VGKTVLTRSIDGGTYLNCDLMSVRRDLQDPEKLFASIKTPFVVLDEVHQLQDPSTILKTATDAFPELRILATGASTLAATAKFCDTLVS
jgi:predicted AAA+ superfamily ATPase